MRVLYILPNLSADSGVSSVVMNVYRHVNKEKVQIDFLVCENEPKTESVFYHEIIANGGRVYRTGNVLNPKTIRSAWRKIKAFFKEHAKEYGAVHLHAPNISRFTLKYAKKFGIPNRIIHSHSSMTSPNKIKAMVNRFLIGGKRYANIFWTCSPEAADFLFGQRFIKKHPVEMIKNAVDTTQFHFDKETRAALRDELGLSQKKVIAHVSNFSAIKNVFFLLPVIQQVAEKDKEIVFLFIGDGPMKNELERKTKELGLEENVRFIGRQPNVCHLLCASDLLLLPSLKEGLPVVTIEAQACGLSCVVTDTITRECNIGLVDFLPLSTALWVDHICGFHPLSDDDRENLSADFIHAPYNIVNEAKKVENLYLNL